MEKIALQTYVHNLNGMAAYTNNLISNRSLVGKYLLKLTFHFCVLKLLYAETDVVCCRYVLNVNILTFQLFESQINLICEILN